LSSLRFIGSNILTAVATAAITSFFWIAAYSRTGDGTSAATPVDRTLILGPTGLAVPVLGVKPAALIDTFSQSRAGGRRAHDALDIMAPAGTPVVAAAPGAVEKLFFSNGGGGISAYVRSPDGRWNYYYAHLRNYAPGLREGQRLSQGDPIGNVGSTGDASPSAPHLHFAINRMEPGQRWWQGTPINPYPLLAGSQANR